MLAPWWFVNAVILSNDPKTLLNAVGPPLKSNMELLENYKCKVDPS